MQGSGPDVPGRRDGAHSGEPASAKRSVAGVGATLPECLGPNRPRDEARCGSPARDGGEPAAEAAPVTDLEGLSCRIPYRLAAIESL